MHKHTRAQKPPPPVRPHTKNHTRAWIRLPTQMHTRARARTHARTRQPAMLPRGASNAAMSTSTTSPGRCRRHCGIFGERRASSRSTAHRPRRTTSDTTSRRTPSARVRRRVQLQTCASVSAAYRIPPRQYVPRTASHRTEAGVAGDAAGRRCRARPDASAAAVSVRYGACS